MNIAFQNPSYLWLLFSLPVLVITHFMLFKHIKKKAMKFANFEAMSRVIGLTFTTKNMSILYLRLCIIFFLIFAAAGTTLWYRGKTNANDIILVIDASASMTATDFEPNRLEAAKKVAIEFVDSLDARTEIGLVTFAGVAFIEQMPTANLNLVKQKIDGIQIMASGGTDLSSAMITSTNMLLKSRKGKAVILLTDGSNTAGSFVDNVVERGAYYAKRNQVIVYTIGIGSDSVLAGYLPKELGIPSFFDEANLKTIANITEGKYYRAENIEDLRQAYSDIGMKAHESYISLDLSFIFMVLALLLVFIEWGLINTKFRALP